MVRLRQEIEYDTTVKRYFRTSLNHMWWNINYLVVDLYLNKAYLQVVIDQTIIS